MFQVSLDSRVRDLINMRMTSPDAHTYDEAQTQIYTLMQRDSYPRFVSWDKYRQLLNRLPDQLTPASPIAEGNQSPKNSSKDSGRESSSRSSSFRRKRNETQKKHLLSVWCYLFFINKYNVIEDGIQKIYNILISIILTKGVNAQLRDDISLCLFLRLFLLDEKSCK